MLDGFSKGDDSFFSAFVALNRDFLIEFSLYDDFGMTLWTDSDFFHCFFQPIFFMISSGLSTYWASRGASRRPRWRARRPRYAGREYGFPQ